VIDCTNAEIRDALPDLLNGKLSGAEATILREHAASCDACGKELALLGRIKESAALAPVMNASAIASAIPAYASLDLTHAAVNRRGRFSSVWKVAAAAAIVTVGIIGLTRSSSFSGPSAVAVAPAPADVAPSIVQPAPSAPVAEPAETTKPSQQRVASLSLVSNLQDLSDDDIEQLIADLDGIQALPAAEPQSVSASLDDMGIDQ